MALETLKGIDEIDGFKVAVMDELKEKHPEMFSESGQMDYKRFEKEIRPTHPIQIRHDKNSISFTIQNGPIKEVGVNGCQVDTLVSAAIGIISGLNWKFPCKENEDALTHLRGAYAALKVRKENREARGVEGENKA